MICTECNKIFRKENLIKKDNGEYRCPIYGCNHFLIEVDDSLMEIVRLFNELNVRTMFCCSGHFHSDTFRCQMMFVQVKDEVDKQLYNVDLYKLHDICEELSKHKDYKDVVKISKISELRLPLSNDPDFSLQHERFSIESIFEDEKDLQERFFIQYRFLNFLTTLIYRIHEIYEAITEEETMTEIHSKRNIQ